MTAIVTEMRAAIETALRGASAVTSAFAPDNVRIYPLAPPLPATFPYVTLRLSVIGDDTECAKGAEVTLDVDVFAREATYQASVEKAEAISDAIRNTVTAKIALTSHIVDDWVFEADRQIPDPDVLTAHRNLEFTYLTTADA